MACWRRLQHCSLCVLAESTAAANARSSSSSCCARPWTAACSRAAASAASAASASSWALRRSLSWCSCSALAMPLIFLCSATAASLVCTTASQRAFRAAGVASGGMLSRASSAWRAAAHARHSRRCAPNQPLVRANLGIRSCARCTAQQSSSIAASLRRHASRRGLSWPIRSACSATRDSRAAWADSRAAWADSRAARAMSSCSRRCSSRSRPATISHSSRLCCS